MLQRLLIPFVTMAALSGCLTKEEIENRMELLSEVEQLIHDDLLEVMEAASSGQEIEIVIGLHEDDLPVKDYEEKMIGIASDLSDEGEALQSHYLDGEQVSEEELNAYHQPACP